MTRVYTTINVTATGIPSWLPSEGQIVDLPQTNSPRAVWWNNPVDETYSPYMRGLDLRTILDQSAMIWNPHYGPFGAWIIGAGGGGHDGGRSNETYLCPLHDPTWRLLYKPFNAPSAAEWGFKGTNSTPSGPIAHGWDDGPDFINNLGWGDIPGWYGFSPYTDHTRSSILAIPGGTNGYGRVLKMKGSSPHGCGGTRGTHILDCAKESLNALSYNPSVEWWRRAAGGIYPASTNPQGDVHWHDAANNRVGYMGSPGSSFISTYRYWDIATETWSTTSNAFTPTVGMNIDTGGCWIADRRLLLMGGIRTNGSKPSAITTAAFEVEAIDFSGNPPHPVVRAINITGEKPDYWGGISMEYCPADGNIYVVVSNPMIPTPGCCWLYKLDPGVDLLNPAVTNAQFMAASHTWTEISGQMSGFLRNGYAVHRRGLSGSVIGQTYSGIKWIPQFNCMTWGGYGVGAVGETDYGPPQFFKPPGVP